MGSKLIPLGQLSLRTSELNRESEIVAYCHLGERSARATQFLRSAGFTKVRNLRGGIDAWTKLVDPNLAAY